MHTDLLKEESGSVYSSSEEDNADVLIYPLYMAKHDTETSMLSFKEGDLFFILNSEGNWWYVRAKHSGEKGYVPRHCLEKCVCLYLYG